MKTTLDILNDIRRIDFDSTNKLLIQIQELLKYQEFMEIRNKKLNKLKQNINER
jgi:hypothetical protein